MNHTELLKRAFRITWRYKPLWLFGFILALCGGSQSGGGGNFNFPMNSSDFGDFGSTPWLPEVDPSLIVAVVAGLVCLILLLAIVAVVAQYVARTALIGMVNQIEAAQKITVAEGWRLGWSRGAWRLFLVSLLIGIPLAIVTILLILLAFSPLLLLFIDNTVAWVVGIALTVVIFLFVILLLILLGVIIMPLMELAWRRAVLADQGVIASLREAIDLVKSRFKDVAIIWLLMIGLGIGWGLVSLVVVLPISLIAALLIGGIPAGLVYLISESWIGAAITGVPLGFLVLILISSIASGFYLIFQSTVWTLTYLEIKPGSPELQPPVGELPLPKTDSRPAEA